MLDHCEHSRFESVTSFNGPLSGRTGRVLTPEAHGGGSPNKGAAQTKGAQPSKTKLLFFFLTGLVGRGKRPGRCLEIAMGKSMPRCLRLWEWLNNLVTSTCWHAIALTLVPVHSLLHCCTAIMIDRGMVQTQRSSFAPGRSCHVWRTVQPRYPIESMVQSQPNQIQLSCSRAPHEEGVICTLPVHELWWLRGRPSG